MTDTMLDFTRLSHHDDPDTSVAAASKLGDTEQVKVAILALLRESDAGLTAFQAQALYFQQRESRGWPNVQPYSINRRMSDMHKETPPRIRDTGARRTIAPNASAAVWDVA